MQERPILNFRQAQEHTDFQFLIVPESDFIPFVVVIGALAVGVIWFWRIRRRGKL
jgi:hypothetical protein